VTINADDCAWLLDLLQAAASGENVAKRFTQNKKASPEVERHFWIACDVAQHRHDRSEDPLAAVAKRWGMYDSDDKGRANVEKIILVSALTLAASRTCWAAASRESSNGTALDLPAIH